MSSCYKSGLLRLRDIWDNHLVRYTATLAARLRWLGPRGDAGPWGTATLGTSIDLGLLLRWGASRGCWPRGDAGATGPRMDAGAAGL